MSFCQSIYLYLNCQISSSYLWRSFTMLAYSNNLCHRNANAYAEFSLNVDGNIFKEFQLPHHHSVSLVLLISHLVTKAQLQGKGSHAG